ncbi:hypothetical protein [Soonwooa sp.]|uniref:hypothetical protein n=1 Tax=Soonwooa sp. TaxID=1938592 RepID=UPI00261D3C14|nr:hypothetical protein [Soonwooa sp.]
MELYFITILVLIVLGVYFAHERSRAFKNSIEVIKALSKTQKIKEIIGVRCSTLVWGGRNTNYLCNRADLYIFDGIFFICGYQKIFGWKILKTIFVVTRNKIEYKKLFLKAEFPIVRTLHNYANQDLFIRLSDENFPSMTLEISFKGLSKEQKELFNIFNH